MRINLYYWSNNIDDDISDTIIKFLSCQNDYFNSLYSHVHSNRFLNKELKQIILGNIQKILFNRYIIRKTIKNHVFKKRKFIKINNNDLLMQPFASDVFYPYIVENNNIYRFGKSDFRNIIKSSIKNCRYRHPSILPIKNPYTNSIISKTQLYNLYIQSYESNQMHWMLREFARLDFNATEFKILYYSYLSSNALKEDIASYSDKEFRKECDICFRKYIVEPFYREGFVYNGLETVNIDILRKFFTQFIIYESENDNISKGRNKRKRITEHIKKLMSFWGNYTWVFCRISENKSLQEIQQSVNEDNANMTLYLNSINNPDVMGRTSPFSSEGFSNVMNRLNRVVSTNRRNNSIFSSISNELQVFDFQNLLYDSSNEDRFIFSYTPQQMERDIRYINGIIADENYIVQEEEEDLIRDANNIMNDVD
tara:strand:+ start:7369 stop:8643 length:1275 start_codon:yes stop_codon:yes gene_type:complete